MNQDQLLEFVKSAVTLAGGWAIGHGYLNSNDLVLVSGIATGLVTLVWGLVQRTNAAKVAAAQAIPAVSVAVSDPALASRGVTIAPPGATSVVVPMAPQVGG